MELAFRPYREIDPILWDDLVANSDDTWLFHLSAWIDAESLLYPQQGFGIFNHDRLVGICPLIRYDYPTRVSKLQALSSGMFPSGPAFHAGLSSQERNEIERLTFAHLRSLMTQRRVNLLVLRLPSLSPNYFQMKVNPLIEHGLLPHSPYGGFAYWGYTPLVRIMDLSGDRNQWLATASSTSRTNFRQLERRGISPEQCDYKGGWRRFRRLQEITYHRSGASVWPESFFAKLESLGGKMAFYFAVTDSGEDVAALWVVFHEAGALYFASAADYGKQVSKYGTFLQYFAMEDAKRRGCRHYVIGPYFPYMQSSDKMYKIGEFKRKLGGCDMPVYDGTLVRNPVKCYILLALEMAIDRSRRRLRSLLKGGQTP